MRNNTEAPLTDVEQVIGDYLYRSMQNILVVDDKVDRRTNAAPLPKREPKGELLIRYEPDTQIMFFMAKPFKEYCVQYQINYAETLRILQERKRLVSRGPKRLSKGMSVYSVPVHAIGIKVGGDFVDVDKYMDGSEEADEG